MHVRKIPWQKHVWALRQTSPDNLDHSCIAWWELTIPVLCQKWLLSFLCSCYLGLHMGYELPDQLLSFHTRRELVYCQPNLPPTNAKFELRSEVELEPFASFANKVVHYRWYFNFGKDVSILIRHYYVLCRLRYIPVILLPLVTWRL